MQLLHNFIMHNLFFMRQQIMHFETKLTQEKKTDVLQS